MFLDGTLTFNSSIGTPQALTVTANSAGLIDITGAGSGNKPAMINSFPPSAYQKIGEDYGAGDGVAIPHVYVAITAVGSASDTFTISLEAAPDNGSTNVPGTWTTLWTTRALVESTLAVGDILDIQVPPIQYTEGEALPRFYRLVYTVTTNITTSVLAYMVINPQQSGLMGQYSNNYIVV